MLTSLVLYLCVASAILIILYISATIWNAYHEYTLRSAVKESKFRPRICIIGAGFSGLCAAIDLKRKLNYDNFTIYEKENEVGGTWHVNRYPGLSCDIPAKLYSYSFALNYKWSREFPKRQETLDYIKDVANDYDLYKYIKFNTRITGMVYNEDTYLWTLTTDGGDKILTNIVISCVGTLSAPNIPNSLIKRGCNNFKGESYHSSKLPEDYNAEYKRIAVIGTGPTAIQIIPEIAKTCKKLYVFQRSASHCAEKIEFEISWFWQMIYYYFPFIQRIGRWILFWYLIINLYPLITPRGWGCEWIQKYAMKLLKDHREKLIPNDMKLRQKVTPKCYVGFKRLLLSNKYYLVLQQKNVELIFPQKINKFKENGIEIIDNDNNVELKEVDCIIYATGYRTQEFLCSIKNGVIGKNGKNLQKDVWQTDNAFAYYGLTVSGFPNLFIYYGPGVNLGTNSILVMIESGSNYVMQCIAAMIKNGWNSIDVKQNIQNKFNKRLDQRHKNLIWSMHGNNWYKNKHDRVATNWGWSTLYYWWLTYRVKFSDFKFTKISPKK